MEYKNTELKLDQVIQYVNDKKIKLVPPFQRGKVWSIKLRRGLIKNMVEGRPIPAIVGALLFARSQTVVSSCFGSGLLSYHLQHLAIGSRSCL